jgi:SAM-dependent methyltransferase
MSMEKQTEKPLAKGWSGQPVWDLALALTEGLPTGRLLDAPSGGGYLAAQFAQRGFEVVGVDILPELWQFPDLPFTRADMDEPLPFDPGRFDVAMHVGGLAHLENPSAILREFHRLLPPGGHLGVTIENVFTLESRTRFLLNGTYRWYPHHQYQGETKEELFLANREPLRLTTLLFLLERNGFTIERVKFGGKRASPAWLPLGWFLRALTTLHNAARKGKGHLTPPIVNSTEAFLCRHVGILAKRKE